VAKINVIPLFLFKLCIKSSREDPVSESKLQLTPETIRYYTQIVLKAQIFQISRRDDRKYLYLLSFVIHQYYRLNDLLTETILQAVQSSVNTSVREHKEIFYETRKNRYQVISDLVNDMNQQLTALRKIGEAIRSPLSAAEKLKTVETLLTQTDKPNDNTLRERLTLLEKESRRVIKDEDYYNVLELRSVKLQNRVSEIIKRLEFSQAASSKQLIEAIEYYKNKDGNLAVDAPQDFLNSDEQSMVFDSTGKIRISLYKVLLFEKVAAGIKSGSLNLRNSYRYRAFDDYLIRKDIWRNKKDELLERAQLTAFRDFQKIESELRQTLQEQYVITNEHILTGKNKFTTVNTDGTLKIITPKVEKDDTNTGSDLFPKDRYIPLVEILSTVNKFSQFSDCFEHWQIKHNRSKPDALIFFAGIMGYGCNIGVRKIAKISRNVRQNELENTVNWYFSTENINKANDKIIELLGYLELPNIFKQKPYQTHTSSDGQKFNIAVESLNANYSYKYFGKDKGVSVYGFLDESHRLFSSTVISPAEREAAYVIDGLMHNEVVQSDIHSTDTHGYSEIIFGVTHLLGISFAPRIKNFKKQYLYNFEGKNVLRDLNYKVLPNRRINVKIIYKNWDDILRFVATIKLKQSTASQLFKRLSSYSRQHPLYFALKEFGKIIKSVFLVKYIDDVTLRQIIELQLNKMESSQKFSKAVFYDNNQEFQQSTKEEQLITEGCKRLIENAIICWNYLYLSQLINDVETDTQKQNLLQTIKNGSVVAWQHINIHGEYDFSDDILRKSIEFHLPELEQLRVD
jgi:TnpA family transposase